MTEEQENMVKAKLAEIADAIPDFKGSVVAISSGNGDEEGDVTVFKRAGGNELVNLFDNIAAQVAIAIAMETAPEKVVVFARRYRHAAPIVLTYGFLKTILAGLSKLLDDKEKEKLDKDLEEVIRGEN